MRVQVGFAPLKKRNMHLTRSRWLKERTMRIWVKTYPCTEMKSDWQVDVSLQLASHCS